jgi:anti-sigma B factor antagonist
VEIDVRISAGRTTLVLSGSLTGEESAQAISATIDAALQRGAKEIVLDLEGVTTIDSAGLGEVVRSYTLVNRQGATLKLEGLSGRLRKLVSFENLAPPLRDDFAPPARDDRWPPAAWAAFWILLILTVLAIARASGIFGR